MLFWLINSYSADEVFGCHSRLNRLILYTIFLPLKGLDEANPNYIIKAVISITLFYTVNFNLIRMVKDVQA